MGRKRRKQKGLLGRLFSVLMGMDSHTQLSSAKSRKAKNPQRAECEELEIEWYEWQTARDARVRASHRNMDGVLVSWKDAPSPERLIGEPSIGTYHAEELEGCRCISLPILRLDGIKWPVRVYRRGHITVMDRKQFKRLSGIN
jgi:hypothetical protein